MNSLLRIAAFAATCVLVCVPARAMDRPGCKPSGSYENCWLPTTDGWKYGIDTRCQVGTTTSYTIAWCTAQGETSSGAERLAQ